MTAKETEATPQPRANSALALVSVAVLLATSVWFSGTAAASTLSKAWNLDGWRSAGLTSSVQLGFIVGTFLYAWLNIADIFNARRVFFLSALMGAVFNASFAFVSTGFHSALLFRFLTGVTLAGIYPVGMRIVASWFRAGLGWRLGVLIGALTLGKASAYVIQTFHDRFDWRTLTGIGSVASLAGGLLVLTFMSDGPFLRHRASFDRSMLLKVFSDRPFRYAAFGYFGHMWELYGFWSLINFYLAARFEGPFAHWVPLLTGSAIGVGAIGCVAGGWASRTIGERRVALFSLLASGSFCALSGAFFSLPPVLLLPLIWAWGFFVIADSAQFSALAARYCPPEYTGTALTVQNGVGFAVTIVSIQLLSLISGEIGWRWSFAALTVGPLVGAWFMAKLGQIEQPNPIQVSA